MNERNMKLICETDGCIAKDKPIELITPATQYMCGACGQFITNATELADGPTEEAV